MQATTCLHVIAVDRPDKRDDRLLIGVNVLSGVLRDAGGLFRSKTDLSVWCITNFGYFEPLDDSSRNRELVAIERVSETGTLSVGDELIAENGASLERIDDQERA